MSTHIVYTRHDEGISVCHPSPRIIRQLCLGGVWRSMSNGELDAKIEAQIAGGWLPDVSRRFIHGLAFGGLTTAEAYGVIRDRDCGPHGSLHEIVESEDLPPDRWFRNAWKRSPNGGPIYIGLKKAREIQFSHIREAFEQTNNRAASQLDSFDAQPIEIDWIRLRDDIYRSDDDEELRNIWPEGLTP